MSSYFPNLGGIRFQSPSTEHLDAILFKIIYSEENSDDAVCHNTPVFSDSPDDEDVEVLLFSSTRDIDGVFIEEFLSNLDDFDFPWRELFEVADVFNTRVTLYYIESKDKDPNKARISVLSDGNHKIEEIISDILSDEATEHEVIETMVSPTL